MNTHSPPTEQDHFDASSQYQEYYQDALREVGIRVPSPKLGQTTREYRRETLHALKRSLLQNHELNNVDFRDLKNDALGVYEPQALKACVTERKNPKNILTGELKPIKVLDDFGRAKHTEFIGGYIPKWDSQESFVRQLSRGGRRVVAFSRPIVETIVTMSSRREIA